MSKKEYIPASCRMVDLHSQGAIMASSIIYEEVVLVCGQELSETIDFSENPIGDAEGKYFNHQWE